MVDSNILNASILEPRIKHATIFASYEDLAPGEHFILQNDHDPRPLYFQLIQQKGEVFSWEYLEQGPTWWKIKITKNR